MKKTFFQNARLLYRRGLISVLFLTLLSLVLSCSNVVDNESAASYEQKKIEHTTVSNTETPVETKSNTPAAPVKKYATICGDLELNGAYPVSVINRIENDDPARPESDYTEDQGRSALPVVPANSWYFIKATCNGTDYVYGEVIQATRAYSIQLELGYTWTIIAGIRASETDVNSAVFLQDSYPLEITENSISDTDHTFFLKPLTSGGNGIIDLKMDIPDDDTIGYVKATCLSDNKDNWKNGDVAPLVELANDATDGKVAKLNIPAIKSGSYEVLFTFHSSATETFPLFTTVQIINVFENMTTSTWADNGNASVINNETKSFKIDTNVLKKYSLTQIYVGSYPGTYGDGLPGKAPSDSNEGTPYSPFSSLNKALSIIDTQNQPANNYTIHITGETTDTANNTISTDRAASITLAGVSSSTSVIRGHGTSSPVLSITTSKPVTFKNIQITGGNNSSGNGGALYLADSSNVTLGDGAVISGNTAAKGGAVYVSPQANFKIKGSAKLQFAASDAAGHNDVYLAKDASYKAKVTIAGNLTQSQVALVTPQDWSRGTQIIQTTGGTAELVIPKFKISDRDFSARKLNSNANVVIIDAPIFIAGQANSTLGIGSPADNANSHGTKESPFASIGFALKEVTNPDFDFTFTIYGTVSGNQELTSITKDANATSLTLKGYIPEGSSSSNATLTGAGSSTLTIDTDVPLIIQDLKITGGSGTTDNGFTKGGGIFIKSSSAHVTLDRGAIVGDVISNTGMNAATDTTYGNKAAAGGGIYNNGGTLILKNGSYVTHNLSDAVQLDGEDRGGGGILSKGGTIEINEGASIILNRCNNRGGGISAIEGASVTMTGGNIDYNENTYWGGGVYFKGASASFQMSGGSISYNKSTFSDDRVPGGGAFYIDAGTFTISGNSTFTENYAKRRGGAICIEENGTVDMQGCTLTGNTTDANPGDGANYDHGVGGGAIFVYQGGTLKMQGQVYIPCTAEKNNDVCLYDLPIAIDDNLTLPAGISSTEKSVMLSFADNGTSSGWKRGRQVLDALTSDLISSNAGRFGTTDSDFSVVQKGTSSEGILTGDIIVAANSNSSYTAESARGSSIDPYKSIADALSNAYVSDYTTASTELKIKGTVTGSQTISSKPNGQTEIKLTGVGTNPTLNGGFTSTSKGTTLTVNQSGLEVTIQDLTITGGYAAANGGGINITAGTIKLVNGAKITGNIAANYGGGVYVAGSSSQLFMSGSSLIGDSATSTTLAKDGTNAGSTTFANKAVKSGGGIYNNGGAVYIGYSGISSGTPVKSDMTSGYGVRRNYAGNSNTTSGGGIQNRSGTLTIASGSISYNQHYNHGGGIYIADGEVIIEAPKTSTNMAKFEGNKAIVGGAIYNGKKLTMSAGQIGGSTSTVQNTVDGTGAMGGAIYQGGSFSLTGSAVVSAGGEKINDVFLPKTNTSTTPPVTYTVAVGTLTTSGTVASITPEEYKRGTKFLSSTTALSNTVKAQFKLTKDDTGWERKDDTSSTTKYVYITSPIYVASSAESDSTRQVCSPAPSTGNNGTKTSPYATIAAALSDPELSKVDNTITIDGTVIGAQSVASTTVDVTLAGYIKSGETSSTAMIKRYATAPSSAASDGTALTVNTTKTVTITNLSITGGKTSGNGAGINIAAGTVKLGDGAKVAGNKASGNGGGVYVEASASLYLYGTALIGDSLTSNATNDTLTTSGTTGCSNYAQSGGGIYNKGTTYIGYSTSTTSTTSSSGGVFRNYAVNGGGIHNTGTLQFGYGTINRNACSSAGGGVYQNGTFNLTANAVVSEGSEKTNDVYLESNKYITPGSLSTAAGAPSTVATITPAVWTRGKQVLDGSYAVTYVGKFKTSDEEFNVISHDSKGKIDADYWVSEAAILTGGSTGSDEASVGRGTKKRPYATIQKAVGQTWKTGEATINVSGTLKATSAGAGIGTGNLQNIPSSGVTATSIKLAGTNNATINANSKGSALTVNGNVVTITNIKFTGGSGTSMTVSGATQVNGGGIYLKAGTLKLGDDVVVTGNTVANNGGGVYVASGANFFMYGKALIGDSAVSTTRASNSGTSYYANKAANGGGIYNAGGSVYIGYDAVGNQKSLYSNASAWYGVRRNVATTQGAGIYHHSGTLLIASGDISYNFADTAGTTTGGAIMFNADATISGGTFTSNKAGNGGALAINSGKKVTIDGAATFKSNTATLTGGAVYNNGGTFTMCAGTIGASGALNTAGNQGGAIYQNGTFNMSGSAVVYAVTSNGVSEKNNDVQLTSTDKYITVNGSLSASSVSGYSMIAAVTPSIWKRGNQVIAPDGTNVSSINSTTAGRFAVSDSEWKVISHGSTAVGKLNADIWVAGTGYDSTGGVCATKAAGSTNRGTKKQPYDSIKTAAEKCWTTDIGFTINISGMISSATQTIPAANATAGTTLASKITLQGSSNTTDGIDRGLASATSSTAGASALIINYQGYVDITNLKIMGGNTTGNGGGIQINGPSTFSTSTCPRVNLKAGTLVQQNKAQNGGGVYSYNSILCLYGDATIGNDGASDRSASDTAITTGINIATTAGGGIYHTGGRLYLGAAWINGSYYNTDTYKLTKGVYANVCTATSGTSSCGGIYNDATVHIYSGNINMNYGKNTGGVYSTGSSASCYMSGGTIHKNAGTGVYNDTNASFWMSGDAVIGDSETASRASSNTDCSNSKGGLINAGTARLGYSSGTTKSKLSGGIYRNYLSTGSKNDGGAGIKNTGTLYFDSGTISYNYAYCTQSQEAGGGGIFSNSTVYMTSSSDSQYSCVKDNKCSEAGGGIYLDGSSAKLLMSGYAIIGKAGQTTPPSSATAAGANTAKYGAGIGSSGGATICLGYSSFTDMDTNTTESLDNGGICYNYATINGGGIYCQGSSTSSINIYMASGKINANKVYYTSSTTYGNGGGIWTNMYCTTYMGGGQISKNSASTFGGGVYVAGKLYMYGNALIGDTGSSVATTGNYGNTAVTGGGVYVTSANGGVFMGCIKEASGGVQYETLNSSYGIRHNYASGASSDIEPSSGIPTGFGGGVYSNKATLFVASGTIGYNLAAKGGGAAILGQYQSLGYTPCLEGANSKIEGNKATADGGGLYIKKDTFEIRGSISSNTAGSDGGGVYNYWSDLEISGSGAKINSNKAQNGGGIFIPEDGSESSGNTSSTKLQNGAQVNSNEATYYGGGIYNYDATLAIYTSSISYNKATDTSSGKGGAMYIWSGGYTRIYSGTVTMTPTSGYELQARYNDIYPEKNRAFSMYTADATISGKVYITLPSTVAADAEIILICGTYPYTPLQSSTYLLTTGSTYYNVKTINTSTGKLN